MVGRATFADNTQVFEHIWLPDASQVALGAPWDPNSPEWVIWEVQVPKFEVTFFGEWGRHGSPWADTLGKRSHGLQEGF